MKVLATRKEEQNEAALDPWSAVHLGVGLAMGLMNMPLRWTLAGAFAYEIVEQFVERNKWGKELFDTSGPETLANAAADMVLVFIGHRLGTRWNRSGKPRHR